MIVKTAFSKAFGSMPDDATCHVGTQDCDGTIIWPTYYTRYYDRVMQADNGKWQPCAFADVFGPDISSRPASAFLGFFGEKYDQAVEEENKINE